MFICLFIYLQLYWFIYTIWCAIIRQFFIFHIFHIVIYEYDNVESMRSDREMSTTRLICRFHRLRDVCRTVLHLFKQGPGRLCSIFRDASLRAIPPNSWLNPHEIPANSPITSSIELRLPQRPTVNPIRDLKRRRPNSSWPLIQTEMEDAGDRQTMVCDNTWETTMPPVPASRLGMV